MVDKTKDNNIDSEIAKRLDDLFGEEDNSSGDELSFEAEDQSPAEEQPQKEEQSPAEAEFLNLKEAAHEPVEAKQVPDDYPLAELKNLMLSIDWEITEEALDGLMTEIGSLKNTYKDEKIITMFLQLLASLGQYIKINRGDAHPKTFKVLNSVFSRLEEVTISENMSVADKKKLLRAEMQKYKQLRHKVSKKKAASAGRRAGKKVLKADLRAKAIRKQEPVLQEVTNVPETFAVDSDTSPPPETLAEAVKELKQYIHSELYILRQELKKLQ